MAKKTTKTVSPRKVRTQTSVSSGSQVTLSDVAIVLRTPNIQSEKISGTARYREVSVPDVTDRIYVRQPQRTKQLKNAIPRVKKYQLQANDLLLSAIGNVGEVAIVPESIGKDRWLASQSFFIIRFSENQKDRGVALYMFLTSDVGQKLLNSMATGKTIRTLPKRAFALVKVPDLTTVSKKQANLSFATELKLHTQIDRAREALAALHTAYLK